MRDWLKDLTKRLIGNCAANANQVYIFYLAILSRGDGTTAKHRNFIFLFLLLIVQLLERYSNTRKKSKSISEIRGTHFRNWANSIYFTEFNSGVWGKNSQNNIRGNLFRENFCPHGICFHIYIYVALSLVLFFSCHVSNIKLRVVFPDFYQAPLINLPRVYGGGLPEELIVINQGPLGTFAWNFALP